MPELLLTKLTKGCVVYCRSHHHFVEDVQPSQDCGDTVVRLACLDDNVNGQITEVFWEREVDARVLGQSTWDTIGQRGFDDPQVFSSYLHTLQWNCVTATDPGLFQAPLRAGIDVKPYQQEPLRKALWMPRVSLFIADDVGLGKTIEAGLIMRELLLGQKVQRVVVVALPSVVLQWQEEMESRFGLPFQVMDRKYVSRMRRERSWGINPWATTHTRFILSQALVRNEDYVGALRDWLGNGEKALLILDEAHNTASASGSKIAVESKLTRAIRALAGCFEYKLFLSATPTTATATASPLCWKSSIPCASAGATCPQSGASGSTTSTRQKMPRFPMSCSSESSEETCSSGMPERLLISRANCRPTAPSPSAVSCLGAIGWPDSARDDVLARLRALNVERYEEEVNLGLYRKGVKQAPASSGVTGNRRGRPLKASQASDTEQIGLAL